MKFIDNQLTIIKKASNFHEVHIFEHIIGHRFFREMSQRGYFLISDFSLPYFRIIDEICLIGIFSQDRLVQKTAVNFFDNNSSKEIKNTEIEKAISEISLEYAKRIDIIEESTLLDRLNQIHQEKWTNFTEFESGGFKDKINSKSLKIFNDDNFFETFAIEIIAPKEITKNNPALRAVAAIAIKTFTLNAIQSIDLSENFYDIGAEWAYDFCEIIYRTNWRFFRKVINPKALERKLREYLIRNKEIFVKNLSKMITENYSRSERMVDLDLVKISDIIGNGGVIGGKIWREFGSEENLRAIFAGIKFKIYRRENIDIISQD